MSAPHVQYGDDPTIPDDSDCFRRVHSQHVYYDENLGKKRASSAAFDDSSNGTPMSVNLQEEMRQHGIAPQDILRKYPGNYLVRLGVRFLRSCTLRISKDPLPDDPSHGYVAGRKTDSVKKKLKLHAEWIIAPPD